MTAFAMVAHRSLIRSLGFATQSGWPERVGFSPADVDRYVSVWQEPFRAHHMVLSLDMDLQIAEALQANEYQAQPDGFWVRGGDDLSFDISRIDASDPFGGDIGMASRVMIEGRSLTYSSSLGYLAELRANGFRRVSQHPDIDDILASMPDTIEDGFRLLQAMVLSDPSMFSPDPAMAQMIALPEPLGPWTAGLMYQTSDGSEEIAGFAIAFASASSATAAAERLNAEWTDYVSILTDRSYADIIGADMTITTRDAAPRVLWISFRAPLDLSQSDMLRITKYQILQQMTLNRDFTVLREF